MVVGSPALASWELNMEILYDCVCGLDVHKSNLTACVVRRQRSGAVQRETRTFSTMGAGILALASWLEGWGATHVALESSGVYWKPVFNLLEDRFTVVLVNAQHVKRVPGRKTDVGDAEWLAELQFHGLLTPSFIPPRAQRDLRDLTRLRSQLINEQCRVVNRIQKVLEDTGCKLSAVASNVLGVSGRAMIEALLAGQTDPASLAELARGRLREKLPALREALCCLVRDHHRFLLRLLLDQLDEYQAHLEALSQQIDAALAAAAPVLDRLTEIPGVDRKVAQVLAAEIGLDMAQFPTPEQLCSWAGLCPGNDESAGKRRSGRISPGNRWLKTTLVQAAWAASHTKDTYLSAQYQRLAKRRGKKRALVAVAHTILETAYWMLKRGTHYAELGADWFDHRAPQRLARYYLGRLEELGVKVTVEPEATVA